MLTRILLLTMHSIDNPLKNVLSWCCWLDVFDEVECLDNLVLLQVVNDEVQLCLREDVDQRW